MLIARCCPGSILPSVSEEGHPWQRPPCSLLVRAGNSPAGLTVSVQPDRCLAALRKLPPPQPTPPSFPSEASPPLTQATSFSPRQEESHQAKQENGGPAKAPHCLAHLSIPLALPPIQGSPCKCHLSATLPFTPTQDLSTSLASLALPPGFHLLQPLICSSSTMPQSSSPCSSKGCL